MVSSSAPWKRATARARGISGERNRRAMLRRFWRLVWVALALTLPVRSITRARAHTVVVVPCPR
jgi:hypothetical protein